MSQLYAFLDEMNMPFQGAKLAVLCDGSLPALLRDDKPDIPFPNHWDLPGGGREGQETPLECAIRETLEELSIRISPDSVVWGRPFGTTSQRQWFFAAHVQRSDLETLKLGEEGQQCQVMTTDAFIAHPHAVPRLQKRLRRCLSDLASLSEKPPAKPCGGR